MVVQFILMVDLKLGILSTLPFEGEFELLTRITGINGKIEVGLRMTESHNGVKSDAVSICH